MKWVHTLLGAVGVLAAALPAPAAERCSIHPAKGISGNQLAALAQVSQAEAQKTAVAHIGGKEQLSIVGAELESEHGCLIWSFDVRIAGKSGVQEVHVDAGNGNVLSVKHEA
jgi:uncharacterized membrane protein YkoI